MTYNYVDQGPDKNLVVDIPRNVEGKHYDAVYAFIEEVKNREIFSTKYRPVSASIRGNVHVVVLSNKMYSEDKISKDRMCLHDIIEQEPSLE